MNGLKDLIAALTHLVMISLPIMVSIALLVFFWGLARTFFKSGDKNAAEEARNTMVWGVVAIFVMVSVWGLVYFIQEELGILDTSSPGAIPSLPYSPGLPRGF